MIKKIKKILRDTIFLFLTGITFLSVVALMASPVVWFMSTDNPSPIVGIIILIWIVFCIAFIITVIKELK